MDKEISNEEISNEEVFKELDEEQQKIVREKLGDDSPEDVELPSDKENRKFADVYNSIDELKKGIQNVDDSITPEIMDGMSDEALELYYKQKNKEFQAKKNPNNKEFSKESDEKKIVEEAGLDWTKLEEQYNKNGSLNEETLKQLESSGIPRQMVDSYIAGLEAQNQLFTEKMFGLAGGEEQFNIIKEWAENNLSDAELDSINSMSNSDALLAMEGVKARYEKANGAVEKSTRITGRVSTLDGAGYTSKEQYMKDVQDPRYTTSQSFAEAVDRKLSKSVF